MEDILSKIKPKYECMTIDAKGSAGGIAILWNPAQITVDYWVGMKRILTGWFCLIGNREWFLVSAVYGPHIPVEKWNFLQQIQKLGKLHDEKFWLIAGDFNLTTSTKEKIEGLQREESEMERFRDLQEELKLVDIPTINEKYTWKNRRGGSKKIASQLDRFLAIEHFIGKDIFYKESILPCLRLDHWPIKIEVEMNQGNQNRPFRFEAFWLRELTLIGKMKEWWKGNENEIGERNQMHTFQLRLKDPKGKIKKWNKGEFDNVHKEQEKIQTKMKKV